MPPPNVTETFMDALTFTLQDILIRFKRKLGFDVLWQPGMDHANSNTNGCRKKFIEEGILRTDLGRDEFVKKIWEWKKNLRMITKQLRSLGATLIGDGDFTLDKAYQKQ